MRVDYIVSAISRMEKNVRRKNVRVDHYYYYYLNYEKNKRIRFRSLPCPQIHSIMLSFYLIDFKVLENIKLTRPKAFYM